MDDLETRLANAELGERMDRAALSAGEFDQQTGAPKKVRMLVDSARSESDRLATLQKFYPDARPFIQGNFLFTNPDTGKPTLYNPGGIDWGDVAGSARMGAEFTGGTFGALAGSAVAPGPGSAVGAGAGAAAGGEVFDAVARKMGMVDTRGAGRHALDTASTAALSAVGQKAGEYVGKGLSNAGKKIFGGGGRAAGQVAKNLSTFERLGATPSVAQATERAWVDGFESFISKAPGGAGEFRKFANDALENIGEGVKRRATALAGRPVDSEIAGRAVQKGVGGWVDDTFRPQAGELYDAINVPQDVPVDFSFTQSTLASLGNQIEGNAAASAALAHPQITRLAQAFGDGPVTYGMLKQFRSAIGRKLSSSSLVDDAPRDQLKQLYGAISEDMRSAAQVHGGPGAVKAWQRADQYWKAGMGRVDGFLEKFAAKVDPDDIVKILESRAKNGGTTIRAITKSLNIDEKRTLAATVMQRLGRAKPSQQDETGELFSLNTFLTNWTGMAPSAKAALFDVKGLGGIRGYLDDIARAAGLTRESARAFQNPSGSGAQVLGQGILYGTGGSGVAGIITGSPEMLAFAAGLGGAGLAANGVARLLTSPRFVRWLSQSTKLNPTGVNAHIGRLVGIAQAEDDETRDAIMQYLSGIGQIGQ